MTTQEIVALLIAERDKLNVAIAALAGEAKRRGRPPGSGRRKQAAHAEIAAPAGVEAAAPVKRKRKLSAAGRKAIAEAARRRWAAFKAGKGPSPLAKKTKRKAA